MISYSALVQRQSLPLAAKVRLTEMRIREWYEGQDGLVSVSFSGGKDSTVLLHLVRSLYPDTPAMFVDTGLEYPEIRRFVRGFDNVTWMRPKLPFRRCIERYGYPMISKKVSDYVYRARHTQRPEVRARLLGASTRRDGKASMFAIPVRWRFLLDAPFELSDRCCFVLKKEPAERYTRETGRHPYLGMMAGDSYLRRLGYQRNGCNVFTSPHPSSRPLGFWLESDIHEYRKVHGLPICEVYAAGIDRTGCFACGFGAHLQPSPNRFERMRLTHPKLHRYCIEFLKMGPVLDYLHIPY